MATIAEIRAQYPQYADMSDEQLARALHAKFYADMPFDQFSDKVGYVPQRVSGPTQRPTNPNQGRGTAELALAGARKFLGDLSLGVNQAIVAPFAALGQPEAKDAASAMASVADVRKLDPTLRTTAGQAGYTAAALVPAVGAAFIPGANTITGATLLGGGLGAVQPTGSNDSRLVNTAEGALAGGIGQAAFNTIGRIAQPVKRALSAGQQKAASVLESKGVPLSVGQATGSRAAQSIERTLGDIPASAGRMAQQGDKFRIGFTRAALRTIGENADGATPEVLKAASKRITSVMNDVEGKYSVSITPEIHRDIANVMAEASRTTDSALAPLKAQIENIRRISVENGGKLPGESVRKIRSELMSLATRVPNAAEEATALANILSDATQKAAQGTDDFARYQMARSQYRNLKAIADSADTTEHAMVSPARLAQQLKSGKYTRNSFRYGRGDVELSKLARAGSTVVDRFPQSGTAPRLMAQIGLPAVMGGASYLSDNDPMQALKIAAATYAIPKAASVALTNPAVQNYLIRGIEQPAVRNALLAPSSIGLGASVPAYLLSQQ